ncbi:MAG: CehA/McbA family metallohydrolase [Verrucomicrobia bacterium]|nr:CehA/McbA family metallohydrolase [Verrucomicrobiota bacterium]
MKTFASILALVLLPAALPTAAHAQSAPPLVGNVELQPLAAQVHRLIEALDYLGEPFSAADRAALEKAMSSTDAAEATESLQKTLDARVLFAVNISPEMRVKVAQGPAKPELVEQGWRQFLVKVANESGTTAALRLVSANAQAVHNARKGETQSDRALRKGGPNAPVPAAADAWLDLQSFDAQPLKPTLAGLPLEYRIVQLYSRDAGKREAKFSFNAGQGTQDLGFRNETDVLFTCAPAREIKLRVLDENKKPTTASFLIRDAQGRVYPSQAKRLAPDFAFHPQIYRADGETLRLPDGLFTIEFERGPESLRETRSVLIGAESRELAFQVKRWIDPSKSGWWSGDHHIHAAGCAHYTKPSEGVLATDMARHCQGEDLKVGANLTWGPCFDYQKQFFTGKEDKVSSYPYLLRYDVEVSGFGSHRSGHLCLLRLREQMYPGGNSSTHWPTLCLNTLRWAKAQGALVGPAHSGWGLQPAVEGENAVGGSTTSRDLRVASEELPNYIVPPFNGIGANEYIVDVTHEVPGPRGKPVPAVDFISTVDTPHTWELNIWYHTLNAGFRTRISGETDFPCIYGERVGLGRSYVKLDGKLKYDDWCEAIRAGRNYVSDGKSHLLDFKANNVALGEKGSELKLKKPATVKLTARVAAHLDEVPNPALRNLPAGQKPYWDVERARIGDTREVPVEVIVNGQSVARKNLVADGALRDVSFEVPIERSSWVALRIRATSHTNPIWVLVGDQPVRPSRRSLEWCLKGVDQCWSQKEKLIAEAELPQARADYEHARAVYRKRLAEAQAE